jgi:hypothetical protein
MFKIFDEDKNNKISFWQFILASVIRFRNRKLEEIETVILNLFDMLDTD